MILLCGIPTEAPLAIVCEQLDLLGARTLIFNQRQFADTEFAYEITDGCVTGTMTCAGERYRLQDFCAVYTRLMDDNSLPELNGKPADSLERVYCRSLHDALIRWCEVTPALVVNRSAPMSSNCSKPYQAQLIREQGFRVPETLITNDPALVHEFRSRHKKVIYKSLSGVRSIVQMLDDHDLPRLERIRWCPTQFQEFVPGTNIRVHVINTTVFATSIRTDATDYRYAYSQIGESADLAPAALPDDLAERCIGLARALGLVFAGIDLKVTQDDEVFCFEVNPSPAYSYYELNTGQPIAHALARCLSEAV